MFDSPFPWWMWLLPIIYALHILEEGLAGERFYRWIGHIVHRTLTPGAFWLANAVLLACSVALLAAVSGPPGSVLLVSAFAAIAVLNGVGHAIGSALTRSYSPGCVSGLVLWAPVGVAALVWALRVGPPRTVVLGILLGVLIQVLLGLLALVLTGHGSGRPTSASSRTPGGLP